MNGVQIAATLDFYVVGGTMRPDAPSYVARRADEELVAALRRGEFCYVLTARQMGKSSLIIRAAAGLRAAGLGVAVLDLTAIGQNLTPEQWYGGLLAQLGQRLDLEDELIEFWATQPRLGPLQRWVTALRTIVLPRYSRGLVIFIDEIDAVRSLPFATDEFFAGIRECYNERSTNLRIESLTFCLSGVATPSDLIRDTRTTPFNIGRRIELHDFTETEAAPLARGLRRGEKQGAALLKRILYWTGGHPYLTQRLCQATAADPNIESEADVDRLCEDLFFAQRARERDNNLLFVRERLLRSEADVTSLLELYAKVRKRRRVSDNESDPLVGILRLSGITRVEAGRLRVRNRIYARVFDEAWIAADTPEAERRRQRAAYQRGVWRTALVSAFVLSLVGWLAFVAIEQARVNRRLLDFTQLKLAPQEQQNVSAETVAELLTAAIYHTQMKLALQEWDNANPDRAEELLEASRPQPGMRDWRSFEWYWLWRLTHGEVFRLQGSQRVVGATFFDQQTLAIGEVVRAKTSGDDEYVINRYRFAAPRQPSASASELSSFRVPAGRNFSLVVFAPDRRLVAVDSLDGPNKIVTLWEVATGRQVASLKAHEQPITVIAFSPDGQRLATGDIDGNVKLWEATSGVEKLMIKWGRRRVWWAAFSPDGRQLATADGSQAVRLWDARTGRELRFFALDESAWTAVAFFPDGQRLLAGATDGSLHIWDVRTRHQIAPLAGHTGHITAIAFSPDQKTLATGSRDRTIKLWDAATGREMRTIRGHGSQIHSVTWSTDGKYLVTGSADGTTKVWDMAARPEPVLPAEPVAAYFVTAFSPTGELLAFGRTRDAQLKLWNLSTGQELAAFSEAGNQILCAALSPDRKLLATGGLDGFVVVWESGTGKLLRKIAAHAAPVYGVAFSPDGRWLISGGGDQALKLWTVASGQQLASLKGEVDNSYRAVFSPDGRNLASACRNGWIYLWDATALDRSNSVARPIRTFEGHTERARAIAFSPDGKLLATGGQDNTVRLWDVATGRELKKLGQSDFIQRASFSPDGRRLVTGGVDGSVKLWDVTTRQELMTLKGHAGEITSLSFSADGLSLATSGLDGTVRLWRGEMKE